MEESDLVESIRGYFLPSWDVESRARFSGLIESYLSRLSSLSRTGPSFEPFLPNNGDRDESILDKLPEMGHTVEQALNIIFEALPGAIDYAHPKALIAASPPVTAISLVGSLVAQHLNPNLVWGSWSGHFAQLELSTIAMLGAVLGYEPSRVGGVFTFGGSGTMLYGAKIGLEKSQRGVKKVGIDGRFRILARGGSHYSKHIVANWLGIGTDNIVEIPETQGRIDVLSFGELLRELVSSGCKIAAILLEVGSTYEFSMDDVELVVKLRDRFVQESSLNYHPHIHADAVIGWVFSVFHGYDFEHNPLSLSPRVLLTILKTTSYTQHLKLADSVGIDFHKLGFAPLNSSCIMVRDRADLQQIRSVGDADSRPQTSWWEYRPGDFTLECSRSAAGMLSAYLNCQLLGRNGLRCLLAHALELTFVALDVLATVCNCLILNWEMLGPAVVFRLYDTDTYNPEAFSLEVEGARSLEEIENTNRRNRRIYDRLLQLSVTESSVGMLSFLEGYKMVKSTGTKISAFKFYILSPFTTRKIVQSTFEALRELALTT